MTAHYQAIDSFKDAMFNAIGCAPAHIEPEKLIRFGKNKTCYCKLYSHQAVPAGFYGDHRTGIRENWSFRDSDQSRLSADYLARKQQWETAAAARILQEQAKAKAKVGQLRAVWKSSKEADANHGHLVRKQVGAYGIRQYAGLNNWYQGALLMPFRDLAGQVFGLQYIFPEKRLIHDAMSDKMICGSMSGMFHHIGKVTEQDDAILISEGYATGASGYEVYQKPVVIAGCASNLKRVAELVHYKYPKLLKIFLADNDVREEGSSLGNTGVEAAREAARAVGGMVWIPDTDYKADFNDLINSAKGDK